MFIFIYIRRSTSQSSNGRPEEWEYYIIAGIWEQPCRALHQQRPQKHSSESPLGDLAPSSCQCWNINHIEHIKHRRLHLCSRHLQDESSALILCFGMQVGATAELIISPTRPRTSGTDTTAMTSEERVNKQNKREKAPLESGSQAARAKLEKLTPQPYEVSTDVAKRLLKRTSPERLYGVIAHDVMICLLFLLLHATPRLLLRASDGITGRRATFGISVTTCVDEISAVWSVGKQG